MNNPNITKEETKTSLHWLLMAQRFISFVRGHTESCRKRSCRHAGMCTAQNFNVASEEGECGRPLKDEDVTQAVQMALFGMMLEEGLLSNPEESEH